MKLKQLFLGQYDSREEIAAPINWINESYIPTIVNVLNRTKSLERVFLYVLISHFTPCQKYSNTLSLTAYSLEYVTNS